MAKFCFFLQISFVLLEFPSHFPQNLFPSNFLHFAKKSFQKEISFKVEALEHTATKRAKHYRDTHSLSHFTNFFQNFGFVCFIYFKYCTFRIYSYFYETFIF
jgi:hypothetical protein